MDRWDAVPRREGELVVWAESFTRALVESEGAWGVATAWAAACRASFVSYREAFREAATPVTRTKSNVQRKREAKAAMLRDLRSAAAVVRHDPRVTDTDRSALGLRVHSRSRARWGRPETSPGVSVRDGGGGVVHLTLSQGDRVGKPPGVAGADLWYWVGEKPPGNVGAWVVLQGTTRCRVTLALPQEAGPGDTVWYTACWRNPRQERGPMAAPAALRPRGALRLGK